MDSARSQTPSKLSKTRAKVEKENQALGEKTPPRKNDKKVLGSVVNTLFS